MTKIPDAAPGSGLGAGAPYPLGVFVGGFRWSGSGAASDWLAGREGLLQHAGSGASFGEIRALNYGLRYLAQTAAGTIRWGEGLGRRALCPEPSLMPELLGRPLSLERGALGPAYRLFDAMATAAASTRIIPRFSAYKGLLDAQLGRDFREDGEYRGAVAALAAELRAYLRRPAAGPAAGGWAAAPWADAKVRRAASRLIGLFHARLSEGAAIPIFDNAFSGLNPELFGLVSPELFAKRVFILVRRDPRDQFADLLRFSGSTFPWSAPSFVRQYRRVQAKAAACLESLSAEGGVLARLLNFERFVLDSEGTRSRLGEELEEFWRGAAPAGAWRQGPFVPAESARNIGQWRSSGHRRSMRLIERELPEFLMAESEA